MVLFAVFCVSSSYSVAIAETKAPNTVESQWDTKKIFAPLLKGAQRFTLSNGMRVVFYRRPHAPVFSGHIWVKVGGVNEVPGQTGAAHMLEHMAFKGSKVIGTKDYQKEKKLLDDLDILEADLQQAKLSKNSAELKKLSDSYKDISEKLEKLWKSNEFSRIYEDRGGVGVNAATGKDYTYYLVSLPNVSFELWAWMESDRLLNPVFRQFYKERAVVREERRSRTDDDPGGKLYEALLATGFWMHPNRFPVIGWPSDLENLKRSQIKELFETYYQPSNMVISLVGDLEVNEVKTTLERYFGRLPESSTEIPEVTTIEAPQVGEREAVVKFDAQPRFALAFHKPVFPDPDDMRFTILHSLLSDGRSSIFYRKMVEGKRMVTSLSSSEAPGELFPSLFYVWGMPKAQYSNEQVIDETLKIIETLKTTPIPAEDLKAAKKRLMVELLTSLSSNNGLARMLGKTELLFGDWRALNDMYNVSFQTSAEDLMNLAKKYFTTDNRTIVRLERLAK